MTQITKLSSGTIVGPFIEIGDKTPFEPPAPAPVIRTIDQSPHTLRFPEMPTQQRHHERGIIVWRISWAVGGADTLSSIFGGISALAHEPLHVMGYDAVAMAESRPVIAPILSGGVGASEDMAVIKDMLPLLVGARWQQLYEVEHEQRLHAERQARGLSAEMRELRREMKPIIRWARSRMVREAIEMLELEGTESDDTG